VEVVGEAIQRLASPHPATYIGRGKVEELLATKGILGYNLVIFDDELLPRQQRNLEDRLDAKVLDRTALILDIFAKHARTREGRLQVELAQYQYRLPRLTRLWTHLSRQGVGGVGLRGPGETQLEVDRRDIRRRIGQLKRELEQVRTHRRLYRRRRERAGIPVVAIVGYTNAGKSTLLNALSGAGVLVEDALFATLDPTTRRVRLPNGREVLFTDTVGFIQKLPLAVVAAFQATLEEVKDAALLLHVVDITHPTARQQHETVLEILEELDVADKPSLTVLNKVDLLDGRGDVPRELSLHWPGGFPISAELGTGIQRLLKGIEAVLVRDLRAVRVIIPYDRSELVTLFHQQGVVMQEEHTAEGTFIAGQVPQRFLTTFRAHQAR
jgi:GTP-binding protein HflX